MSSTAVRLNPLSLTGGHIDRGGQDRRRQEWLDEARADDATRVLALVQGRTPVAAATEEGIPALAAPTLGALRAATEPGGAGEAVLAGARSLVWLGRVDGVAWVAADFTEAPAWFPALGTPVGLREAGGELDATEASLFTQAVAVTGWHARAGFCPSCGAPTEVVDAGWVRRCPVEGLEHFPRTDPAVIVLITDARDRVLLGANAAWGGARYSCFAGFVEPGESLEEAVVREVGEEAGLAVRDPRYLGSQPWPFPRSLMLAFQAIADTEATAPDGEEIVAARWFTRAELEEDVRAGRIGVPGGVSVAGAMLRAWFGAELPEAAR